MPQQMRQDSIRTAVDDGWVITRRSCKEQLNRSLFYQRYAFPEQPQMSFIECYSVFAVFLLKNHIRFDFRLDFLLSVGSDACECRLDLLLEFIEIGSPHHTQFHIFRNVLLAPELFKGWNGRTPPARCGILAGDIPPVREGVVIPASKFSKRMEGVAAAFEQLIISPAVAGE